MAGAPSFSQKARSKYVFRKFNLLFFNNFLSGKEFQSDPQRLHSAVSHIAVFLQKNLFRQRGKSTHLYVRNIDSPAKRRSKNADGKKHQWDKRSTEKNDKWEKRSKEHNIGWKIQMIEHMRSSKIH